MGTVSLRYRTSAIVRLANVHLAGAGREDDN